MVVGGLLEDVSVGDSLEGGFLGGGLLGVGGGVEEGLVSLAYLDLDCFSRYCFGDLLTYPNTGFHREWYGLAMDDSVRRALLIYPRNSAKTTVWAQIVPLWLLGRDPDLKMLLVSRAFEKACENLRFIKNNIENNPYVQRVFPGLKPGRPWSKDAITVENSRQDGSASVLARGLEGQITGFRADVIIVDDLIDQSNVMTDSQREKVNAFWNTVIFPTLNPGGRIFVIGTRYSHKDFYSRLLEDESFGENRYIQPAYLTDEDGKFIRDGDGRKVSYWPERWPVEELEKMEEHMGALAFNSQYLCDPSGYEGSLFDPEWLHYYTVERDLDPVMGRLDYVMGVDPNINEDPKSDNTCIVTLAIDRKFNDVYVLDIFAEPLNFIGQAETLAMYANRAQLRVGKRALVGEQRIRKVGVETVAYQKALYQTGYTMGIPVVEVTHGKTNKITRLLRIQPHIQNGRIKFPDPEAHPDVRWWERFLEEYTTFPRGRRDDMMDALEIAVEVAGVVQGGSSIPFGPGGESRRRWSPWRSKKMRL